MDPIGRMLENSRPAIPDPRIYEDEVSEEERRRRSLFYRGVTDAGNTFDSMRVPKGFGKTLDAFRELASGRAPFSMLMVYGGTGNGKSRCCEALVLELDRQRIYCCRWRWCDIVRTLKSCFNGRGTMSYDEYFNRLRMAPRLILDDVGSGSTWGDWERGELEDIVDYRYERKLFTVLTMNLDIIQIPDRILSRFRDKNRAKLILNEAVDQRPLNEVDL